MWPLIYGVDVASILAMDEKRFFVMQPRQISQDAYRTQDGKWAYKARFAATYTKAEAEPLLVNGAYLKEAP